MNDTLTVNGEPVFSKWRIFRIPDDAADFQGGQIDKPSLLLGSADSGIFDLAESALLSKCESSFVLTGSLLVGRDDLLGEYHHNNWEDGYLTRLFRQAESGVKVGLLIKDVTSLSYEAIGTLASALTVKDGCFVLELNKSRPMKSNQSRMRYVFETIKAPVENLTVIATALEE